LRTREIATIDVIRKNRGILVPKFINTYKKYNPTKLTFQRLDKEVPNKNNRSSAYNNVKPKINDAKIIALEKPTDNLRVFLPAHLRGSLP